MNNFKEMAEQIRDVVKQVRNSGLMGKDLDSLEAIAKRLEEFEAVIFVSTDEDGTRKTAGATLGFPLRFAHHNYLEQEKELESEMIFVASPDKLKEWIEDHLKGSEDAED